MGSSGLAELSAASSPPRRKSRSAVDTGWRGRLELPVGRARGRAGSTGVSRALPPAAPSAATAVRSRVCPWTRWWCGALVARRLRPSAGAEGELGRPPSSRLPVVRSPRESAGPARLHQRHRGGDRAPGAPAARRARLAAGRGAVRGRARGGGSGRSARLARRRRQRRSGIGAGGPCVHAGGRQGRRWPRPGRLVLLGNVAALESARRPAGAPGAGQLLRGLLASPRLQQRWGYLDALAPDPADQLRLVGFYQRLGFQVDPHVRVRSRRGRRPVRMVLPPR